MTIQEFVPILALVGGGFFAVCLAAFALAYRWGSRHG